MYADKNEFVKISKAWKAGNSIVVSLSGFAESGRHYSIRKCDGIIIIEDIEDFLNGNDK